MARIEALMRLAPTGRRVEAEFCRFGMFRFKAEFSLTRKRSVDLHSV